MVVSAGMRAEHGVLSHISDVTWFSVLAKARFLTWMSRWTGEPLTVMHNAKEKQIVGEDGREGPFSLLNFNESMGQCMTVSQ